MSTWSCFPWLLCLHLPAMLSTVKISAIFHLTSFMRIIHQTPEFFFAIFFRYHVGVFHWFFLGEPLLLEFVTERMEFRERVFPTIFKAIIAASTSKTMDTIPFTRRDSRQRRFHAEYMVGSITVVTDNKVIIVSFFTAYRTNIFIVGVSFYKKERGRKRKYQGDREIK